MPRHSYSLASRSSRRRKMMMLLGDSDVATTSTPKNQGEQSFQSQHKASIASLSHSTDIASEQLLKLQKLLVQEASMRWVFAGDSRPCSLFDSPETFPRLIEDHTKSLLGRDSDIFVNATYAGARLKNVRKRIRKRFSQFQPEVVVVMCSFSECQDGADQCSEFEVELISLLKDIQQVGAVPVFCTPPFSDVPPQSQKYIDRLITIEALRGCVAEHSGLLIDFWNALENHLQLARLFDTEHHRPTQIGLLHMQQHFLSELKMQYPFERSNLKQKSSVH